MTSYSPAGWYADPAFPGGARYWNGVGWTEAVYRDGVTLNVPIDPAHAGVAPVPGSQVGPPPGSYVPAGYVADTPTSRNSGNGSTIGIVIGVFVAVFFVVLIFAIVSNNDSSDDSPSTDVPSTEAPTTEAPATEAPATEAPADGG